MKRITTCLFATTAALAMTAGSVTAAPVIIYQDDFSGHPDVGTDGLNGETPDVGANNWVAGASFGANGTIVPATNGDPTPRA